jgi:5-methylcytosine-specific restriction endonuclease McrA
MLAYLESVFGYTPKTADDRLRVARRLETLPLLTDALAGGELPYSAVKELVRVATPGTERAWREAVRGKVVHQIEQLVSGHHRGDLPTDPVDPAIVPHKLVLELLPETYARFRETHARFNEAAGERLDYDRFISALCEAAIAGLGGDAEPRRAKYQIALRVCPQCKHGTQDGAGIVAPVLPSTVARAECDARRVGDIDPQTGELERTTQDIPPKVREHVMICANHRCQTPGCRSAMHLEVHHIVHREHGGSHDPSNLVVLCSGCHQRHHDGALRVTGTAPDHLVFERPHAQSLSLPDGSRFSRAERREELKKALVSMGFKRPEAGAAADKVASTMDPKTTLEDCLRQALRCFAPTVKS